MWPYLPFAVVLFMRPIVQVDQPLLRTLSLCDNMYLWHVVSDPWHWNNICPFPFHLLTPNPEAFKTWGLPEILHMSNDDWVSISMPVHRTVKEAAPSDIIIFNLAPTHDYWQHCHWLWASFTKIIQFVDLNCHPGYVIMPNIVPFYSVSTFERAQHQNFRRLGRDAHEVLE